MGMRCIRPKRVVGNINRSRNELLVGVLTFLVISHTSVLGITVAELNERLAGFEPVTISSDDRIEGIGPNGENPIVVPFGGVLILDSTSVFVGSDLGGLQVQGQVIMNSSTILGAVMVEGGKIEYHGDENAIELLGEFQSLSVTRGGSIAAEFDQADASIRIESTGAKVLVQGFRSSIRLNLDSRLTVGSNDETRGSLVVQDGADLGTVGEEIEGERFGADILIDHSDMTVTAGSTVNLQVGNLQLLGSPDGRGSVLNIKEGAEMKLASSGLVANHRSTVSVEGNLELNGSVGLLSQNSPLLVSESGMIHVINQAIWGVFESPITIAGLLSSFNSQFIFANGTELKVLGGGHVSTSVSSLFDRSSGQPNFPGASDDVISLGTRLLQGAKDLARKQTKFNSAEEGANGSGLSIPNPSGASMPPSLVIDNAEVTVQGSLPADNRRARRQAVTDGSGSLSIGTFCVVGGGSKLSNEGRVDVNGLLLIDLGAEFANTGTVMIGGNEFLKNFPRRISSRGSLVNEGLIENEGGRVEVFEGARLTGDSIVNTDGGRVETGLVDPFPVTESLAVEIAVAGNRVAIRWSSSRGHLEVTSDLQLPFNPVEGARSGFEVDISGPAMFFRVR